MARRVLLPIGLLVLASGLSTALLAPFLTLFLTTAVRAGPARVTVFLVAAPLAGVVVATLIGRRSDRRPIRRRLIIATAVAGLAGSAATAVIRDYWALLALTVTATALATALFPQTFAYARQALERDRPARAAFGVSALRTVFSLAWVAGPPLAAALLAAGGFRLLYAVAAAIYAAALLVAVVGVDEIRGSQTGPAAPVGPAPPALWLTAAAFVLVRCPLTLGVQALPLFVTADLHGRVGDAGRLLGLCALLEIPLMLGLGGLSVRIPLRRLVLGCTACGVGYYVLATATSAVWPLYAGQLLNAIFIAGVSGLGLAYLQDLLPGEPGRATTLFTNTFPVGAILAGPLLGLSAHAGYRLAMGLCVVLAAAGTALLAVVRTRGRPYAL